MGRFHPHGIRDPHWLDLVLRSVFRDGPMRLIFLRVVIILAQIHISKGPTYQVGYRFGTRGSQYRICDFIIQQNQKIESGE